MKRSQGVALVETLIAAPVVLWLGLAVLQWALVFHARGAVSYALHEAARAGTLAGADPDAIDGGLARGLVPFLPSPGGAAGIDVGLLRARAHVTAGKAAGWILLRQLSPTAESFADWAEPDIDSDGRPVPSRRVIPNDNLTHRIRVTLPAGGIAGHRGEEPIGAASGQTLADANLLKLELTYGVPLSVPFVAPLAAWALRIIDGCRPGAPRRVGLLDLGKPEVLGRAWPCPFYDAVDEGGRALPRIPIRLAATVRMQSPARYDNGARLTGPHAAAAPLGTGRFDAGLAPIAAGEAPGLAPLRGEAGGGAADGASGPGFLQIGGAREALALGACVTH